MKFELPRGIRDIDPDEYITIEYLREKFVETANLFDFKMMEPSPIEMLYTLQAKSGPQIGNEIYAFKDKGERDIALRFDLTVGLTRYIINRRDMPLPAKLASFGGVWRYDEPQMGRYRWFHQWDIEIYDNFNIESDAEVIEFTQRFMDSINLDTVIDICDRELLEDFIRRKMDISNEDLISEIFRAIDKVPKKGKDAILAEYTNIERSKLERLLDLSSIKGGIEVLEGSDLKTERLYSLMDSLKDRNVRNTRINMGIVRGLDYYSSIVFEVFAGGSSALVGGGRYDRLPSVFGRKDMGATGAAAGIERIASLIKPEVKEERRIYVAYTEGMKDKAANLASRLRAKGIPATFDIAGRSLKKQLENAAKSKYRISVIVAGEEISMGNLIVRDMRKGSESRVKLDRVISKPEMLFELIL